MKAETKYFGEIEFSEEEPLTFPRGLFGFEDEKSFLLLPFEGNGTLYSLQSLSTPQLAFVLMDPFSLEPTYTPVPEEEELAELGARDSTELYYFVMCVVKSPVADSTVNLKCPVAINPDTRVAMQVILEDDAYEMRHRLGTFEKRKDGSDADLTT